MIGAIEAGGTKFVCAVGNPDGTILDRTAFPTTTPEETLAKVEEFFSKHKIEKLGVGAFEPKSICVQAVIIMARLKIRLKFLGVTIRLWKSLKNALMSL